MLLDRFNGRKVLVTGHTGFKGSWLCLWLRRLNAEVHGLALEPDSTQRLFEQLALDAQLRSHRLIDIRNPDLVGSAIREIQPDFIFHLAAQPLVRRSYHDPMQTFTTNAIGTANLLDAVRQSDKSCIVIVVTTDKCYENREWVHAYREEDPLGGFDPYSASKACAEIITSSFRNSFFIGNDRIRVASARAGNVIGGGDWSQDRIFPDIIRSVRSRSQLKIRNALATRPWQHVLEPLSGYLWLAAKLDSLVGAENLAQFTGAFNFGPQLASNRTVRELVNEVAKHVPLASADEDASGVPHEAGRLNLAIDKAHHLLGWQPIWNFEKAVAEAVKWYQGEQNAADLVELSYNQIERYTADARQTQLTWAT